MSGGKGVAIPEARVCLVRALFRRLLLRAPVSALFRSPSRFSRSVQMRGGRVVTGDLPIEATLTDLLDGGGVGVRSRSGEGEQKPPSAPIHVSGYARGRKNGLEDPILLDRSFAPRGLSACEKVKGAPLCMPSPPPVYDPYGKARRAFGRLPSVGLEEGFERIAEWISSGRP